MDEATQLLLETVNSRMRFVCEVGPVSYTHLRAHETVLDLVCRLLLEKKTHPTDHAVADTKHHECNSSQAKHVLTRV